MCDIYERDEMLVSAGGLDWPWEGSTVKQLLLNRRLIVASSLNGTMFRHSVSLAPFVQGGTNSKKTMWNPDSGVGPIPDQSPGSSGAIFVEERAVRKGFTSMCALMLRYMSSTCAQNVCDDSVSFGKGSANQGKASGGNGSLSSGQRSFGLK